MDPGWPANPSNKLICILCKSAMPYHNNSERFFRHLLADHCTYFNHNLLLEISLMQPHAVREERQSVAGRIERVAESVLDQVNVLPIKNERETSSSSLADPDSTSNKENSINLLANTSEENLLGNFNLEETCSTARQVSVNKNNQPVPCLQDPGSKLLPFDLRMLIVRENPTRGIKFSFIQRTITQMVVDDYMLKKMKGPCLTKGGRVVNWKCTNDHCQYTAVTWEGQLQDTARQHNHPRQPELYVKKQARVKIRENMGRDILNLSNTTQEEKPVNNVVMDVVTETNPDMRNMIGSIDALKQAARRYNRKLHKESQQVYVPNLFVESDRLYLPDTVYQNYEVVGEFPTDYQFPLEVSDQVAHYTEVSTVDIDTPDTPSVTVETDTVEPVTMHTVAVETVSGGLFTDVEVDVLAGSVNNSEQVTLDEETGAMISEDTVVEKMIEDSTTLKINEIEIFTKDDVEELLEPSPTKDSPLRDELISE